MLDYHKISIFNGMEMEILKVESFTPLKYQVLFVYVSGSKLMLNKN